MGDKLETAALGIGTGIVDNVANQIFGQINQNRQLKGLDKSLQIQNRHALEMWEKTGYGAQKKQMQEAGINPALLYGMSGGGSQTTGAAGEMPTSPGTKGMDIAGAAQLALINAQKDNIEADTALKRAGIPKDTEQAGLYKEQALTEQERREGQKLINKHQELENQLLTGTMESMTKQAAIDVEQGVQELDKMKRENKFGEETYKTRVKQLKADYLLTLTTKALIEQQTKESGSRVKVNEQQVKLMERQVIRMIEEHWEELDKIFIGMGNLNESERKGSHDRFIHNLQDNFKLGYDVAEGILQAIIVGGALKAGTKSPGTNPSSTGKPWYQSK